MQRSALRAVADAERYAVMLQFWIKCIRPATAMPRFARRGR
jgi:hypothetical protein